MALTLNILIRDDWQLSQFERDKKMTTKTELLLKIESEFKKVFPDAWMKVNKAHLGKNCFFITFGIQSKENIVNSISHNDLGHHCIGLYGFDGEMLPSTLDVEKNTGGSLTVRPPENSFYAFGSVKYGWRNSSKVTPEKVVAKFTKYFKKMKKVNSENIDNLPKGHGLI